MRSFAERFDGFYSEVSVDLFENLNYFDRVLLHARLPAQFALLEVLLQLLADAADDRLELLRCF